MTVQRIELAAWVLFVLGVAGCAAGWALSPAAFGAAWLAALMLLLGWPVGSIAISAIHVITGGRWGAVAQPALLLGILATPIILLAVIPTLILAFPVYGWAHHDIARQLGNTRYLNLSFFWGREAGIAVLWVLLAAVTLLLRVRFLAALVLGLLLVSVTVAAVDLNLSLEPHFNSTAFGMVIAAEWALFALAIATFGAALAASSDSDGLESIGKLLLVAVTFWGYLVFVQFLIVWNSDIAAESPWFVHRAENGWGIVAYILFVFHFVIPFLALLPRRLQRSRQVLLGVSALLVATEIPRAWWLVLPSFGGSVNWIDGVAMIAVLGLGVGLFLRMPMVLERLALKGIGHA